MKLISCHIENFGAIERRDYDFSDGLTCFCEANGSGKTTLAAFLKAMFYGLPADTARSKFNERRHYYPFSGGKFGGNVTFRAGGKVYRIERFFGRRSETEDTLKVFVDGAPAPEFDKKSAGERTPGEIIFGLDEQSFERTVFINAEKIDMSSTGGINAKLNDYVSATEGDADAQAAVASLEKAAKNLKVRGGRGLIADQEAVVRELNASVSNLGRIAESLDARYAEYNALSRKIEKLEDGERERNRRDVILGKWARYDDMCAAVAAQRAELNALSERYPCGIPAREEISALGEAVKNAAALKERASACAFTHVKEERLAALSERFLKGVPDGDRLKKASADTDRLRDCENLVSHLKEGADTQRLASLEARFGGKVPSDEQLELQRGNVQKYEETQRLLIEMTDAPAATERSRAPKIVAAVLAALLIVGGAALLFVNLTAGIIALAAGAVSAVCAVALLLRGGKKSSKDAAHTAELRAKLNSLKESLHAFLVPYGVYSSDVAYDFKKLTDDLAEYARLSDEKKRSESRVAALVEEAENLRSQLGEFFADYSLTGVDFAANLTTLTQLSGEYARLKGEKAEAQRQEEEIAARLRAEEDKARAVTEKYRLFAEQGNALIIGLEKDAANFARLSQSVKEGEERAERYREENSLNERPVQSAADGAAEELTAARERYAVLSREIADDEAKTETLPDKLNSLKNAEEKLKDYREKYEIYTAAAKAIETAERQLNDRYVAPIRDKFVDYSLALESAIGEKVSMDKDFKIMFERGGENRSDGHLSAGQRAICSLCFRLALIDNLYEDEKPFIIMDDPFVELDGRHLACAEKLLKTLAKDKQIIYFCCHESRAIKG